MWAGGRKDGGCVWVGSVSGYPYYLLFLPKLFSGIIEIYFVHKQLSVGNWSLFISTWNFLRLEHKTENCEKFIFLVFSLSAATTAAM